MWLNVSVSLETTLFRTLSISETDFDQFRYESTPSVSLPLCENSCLLRYREFINVMLSWLHVLPPGTNMKANKFIRSRSPLAAEYTEYNHPSAAISKLTFMIISTKSAITDIYSQFSQPNFVQVMIIKMCWTMVCESE